MILHGLCTLYAVSLFAFKREGECPHEPRT